MIGYVINYKDEEQRRLMPSGLLITHPMTSQIIALGASPLSRLLQDSFAKGLEFPVLDKLRHKTILKSRPYELPAFEKVAPLWFTKAGFKFVKIQLIPPLSAFVPVALDLSAAYNKEPFEKIQLVAGGKR